MRNKLIVCVEIAILVMAALAAGPVLAQQPAPPAPLDRLKNNIERITRSVSAKWGIYVKCLETGEEIAINADEQMDTMSVIKIPLMGEAFEQIKAGKFALAEEYTLTKEDMLPGTGILRSLDVGAVVTVRDLITLMIIVSDNTATDVLYHMVAACCFGGHDVSGRLKILT
jgi:beta-lactamase class A